jgi:hypothetical protein
MNEWDWWQDKLAGGNPTPIQNEPQSGFYRKSSKEHYGARKTFMPVAFWRGDDGYVHCRIGDEDVSDIKALETWNGGVHANPVTEEAYRAVAERGESWPDEHELVPMQGHNRPPEDFSYEGLRDAIEPLAREAIQRIDFGPAVTTQDEADQLANLSDRLAELWKKADEARKEEKRPYDEGARVVQLKWSPLLLAAEAYKNVKYKLITPWLQKLEEAKKQEAEAAAAAGEPPAVDDPSRRPRAGTRGRATSLKSTKRAEITDYPACLAFFAESEDVRSTVQMLANRAVRAGLSVPGAKLVEEQKAV